jgi:hypothetical protein
MSDLIQENYNLALSTFTNLNNHIKPLIINVLINGNQYKGLLDTGASHTIISRTLIENENLDFLIDPNIDGNIQFLNHNISVSGRIWLLNISIYNLSVNISPLIFNNLDYDIIFGRDFIHDNNIVIYLSDNMIVINDYVIHVNID